MAANINSKKSDREISRAVISRLPRYYRYLRELIEEGIEKISSGELSERMGATASQIRQDFNHFGGFGQQGYGYNVEYLYNEIGRILGVGTPIPIIVIGSGNLGRALVKYTGFEKQGFNFCGMFDVDPKLCGKSVNGVRIRKISELEDFIKSNDVVIAALTIPREAAHEISEKLYDLGIRYYWNFAHTDLELPHDAIVKNVHLQDSLLELSYAINSAKEED